MTNQDCPLDGELTTIQGYERIRRSVLLLVQVGSTISIIAVVLAVLIVIWGAGRKARIAWAAVLGPLSAMRNEHSGKYTPRPQRCPSCARIMRLARASRFRDLYIQYVFECRACGVSHIDAVEIEAA